MGVSFQLSDPTCAAAAAPQEVLKNSVVAVHKAMLRDPDMRGAYLAGAALPQLPPIRVSINSTGEARPPPNSTIVG